MVTVVDTSYYDVLGIKTDATEIEIKKAYRRMAIITHPDKNPDDETAHLRFQEVGEAYQVLSDRELRKRYDQFGKDKAVPDKGFEDPAEFFTEIFGGEAFVDLIGEISLIRDLTKSMEIATREAEAEEEAQKQSETISPDQASGTKETNDDIHPPKYSESANQFSSDFDRKVNLNESTPAGNPPTGVKEKTARASTPSRNVIAAIAHGETGVGNSDAASTISGAGSDTSDVKKQDKKKKKNKNKIQLSDEQRKEIEQLSEERSAARKERVALLTSKLNDKVGVWTETEKGEAVTSAFQEKIRIEAEELKLESFGIQLLHSIGYVYYSKGSTYLKSQKFLGVSGFFSRVKEKGTMIKDTWNTISSALDAQMTVQELAKAQEEGGDDWTVERQAELERQVMGKVLNAAWNGSRFEIQSVLREVCDNVIYDKTVPVSKRVERAQALMMIGRIFRSTVRTAAEEEEARVFEELVAEAVASKKNGKKKQTAAQGSKAANP